jgi:hypothetical protein
MNTHEEQIQEIELSMAAARKMVALAEQVKELQANTAFRAVVTEGYFTHEAARLVHLSGDPNIPENVRAMVARDLFGPPALNRYLQTVVQMGYQAAQALEEGQEMISAIHAEESAE